MRRLAPLGQIVERLSALEESLRTGRAPTGGAGTQTPPASPANLPPRRGMAGGGGGASSLSPVESAPNLKLVPTPAQSNGGVPSFSGDAASRAADAPFSLSNDEGADASAHDTNAPPFFVEARAGETSVGLPVSLSSAQSSGGTMPAPAAQSEERAADEPCDDAGRIKRGLEERGKPLLAAALEGARRVFVDGDEVRVEFAPEGKHLRDTLKRPENMRLLREVCCEVLGRNVGVGFAMRSPGNADDDASAEDEARREQKRLRERAENHPVVQKVLKTFRAEIVDVRRTDNA